MENKHQKKVEIQVNTDTTPILYTDNIFMSTNEDGVTLDIGQKIIGVDRVRVVSRIGMSRSHAKKFITEFSRLLAMTEGQSQTGEERN